MALLASSCFVCKRNYTVIDYMIVVFSPQVFLNVVVVVLLFVSNCEHLILHRSISLSLCMSQSDCSLS